MVNSAKPIANGVRNGFGQVATGAGDSLDRAVRLQTVESNNWQQPVNVQHSSPTTLPLTTWTGNGEYQPVRRK
ncbi:MAG: hypothetical protein AAF915_21155 [Cyanobacteria bacterium P01_D01_bin.50]